MGIKNILVTGSEGYIGSTLVRQLIENKYKVIGLDTLFFKYQEFHKNHEIIICDIRNTEKIDLNEIDAIIHLAALSNDPIGELDSQLTLDINYNATINLAKKAKSSNVKKFIFSSSCSVYGTTDKELVDESSMVNPLTAYAESKVKAEKDLIKLADGHFEVVVLRNSTVYGYSQNFRDDLVVNNLTASAITTNSIDILSDGSPWRPLIDVRDLSNIFIEFLSTNKKINGEIINIGFEENNLKVKDIVNIVSMNIPSAKVNYLNRNYNDKRSYKVEFKKLRAIFPEFRQSWTVDRSVKDLVIKLRQSGYDNETLTNGRYSRLKQLKQLLESNKIDANLYWKY